MRVQLICCIIGPLLTLEALQASRHPRSPAGQWGPPLLTLSQRLSGTCVGSLFKGTDALPCSPFIPWNATAKRNISLISLSC